jgi:hypothetical protein
MQILVRIIAVAIYGTTLILGIWLLGRRSGIPLKKRLMLLLDIVGAYTLLLGFLSDTGIFGTFEWISLDLVSADPIRFLRGNLLMFSFFFSVFAVAFSGITNGPLLGNCFRGGVLLTLTLGLLAYIIIHFCIVMPAAYFAYLFTSVPVDAVLQSTRDIAVGDNTDATVRIKELFVSHQFAIRNFGVGLPAIFLSSLIKLRALYAPKQTPNETVEP